MDAVFQRHDAVGVKKTLCDFASFVFKKTFLWIPRTSRGMTAGWNSVSFSMSSVVRKLGSSFRWNDGVGGKKPIENIFNLL